MSDRPQRIRLMDLERHGEEQSPRVLRAEGLRQVAQAGLSLELGEEGAEQALRAGVRTIVDAFLADRQANADLFTLAHKLGEVLSSDLGCPWTVQDDAYTLRCPVTALHRPVAHSMAFVEMTECSICDAEPFACTHVPGDVYDGQLCQLRVTGFGLGGHIAWTANPDFLYTWHQEDAVTASKLIADGKIEKAGDIVYCQHCQECPGKPAEGDLDPEKRYETILREIFETQRSAPESDSEMPPEDAIELVDRHPKGQ